MSTEAVTRFLQLLADNEQMRAELESRGKTAQERIAAAVELGADHGFEFTPDECTVVLDALNKHLSGELTDSELEAVSGGYYEDTWTQRVAAWVARVVYWLRSDDDEDDEDDDEGFDGSPGGTAIAGVRG